MKHSLHHLQGQQSQQTPAAPQGTQVPATPRLQLSSLPMGATQLDRCGRLLHRWTGGGFAQEPRTRQVSGPNFFEQHLLGTELAYLEEVYREGVRNGELYHFVDVEIGEGSTARELTLFLYFHAATGQGWLFIEPHSSACEGPDLQIERVA